MKKYRKGIAIVWLALVGIPIIIIILLFLILAGLGTVLLLPAILIDPKDDIVFGYSNVQNFKEIP
jgi:hypothetical protein